MRSHMTGFLALTFLPALVAVSAAAGQVRPASPGRPSEVIGYFSLSGPAMTETNFMAESVPDTFTLWIWLDPLDNGLSCAAYKILLPENVTVTGVVTNIAISGMTGSIADPGVTFCFFECQYGPVWTHQVNCVVTDTERTFIFADYYLGSGPNEGTDCQVPEGTGEIRARGPFGINIPVAVDESSWGAVKSLYVR